VPATRVSLALGSGGARGYAHIGAIQVLQERGIQIVGIAGSSMGALVGGLHAAGRLEAYTEWALTLKQRDVLRLLDVSLSAPGALRAERIFGQVGELLGDRLIEQLDIPFTAVATDLLARREVWFERGPVDIAIRASSALPGLFPPVMLNGRLLVDGGLMDPVPVAPMTRVDADATIAISLGGERQGTRATAEHDTAEPRPVDEWIERFRRGAAQALEHDRARALLARFGSSPAATAAPELLEEPAADESPGAPPAVLTKLEVMDRSIEAMQAVVTRYRLAGAPPDVLIDVPRDVCRPLDFHRAAAVIELGRQLATDALDRAGF